MNNKGFTLIEILAVVAILSMLGVLIALNSNKMFERNEKEQCDNLIQKIEDAACVYTTLNSYAGEIEISVGALISKGLIELPDKSCVSEIDKIKITKITEESYEKKCEYKGVTNEG